MISDNARAGMQQAPARSLFNALGFTPEEMTLILDILKDGKSKEERQKIKKKSKVGKAHGTAPVRKCCGRGTSA